MRRLLHLAVIIALLAAPFIGVRSAYAALGWVGNMWPLGGSVTTITTSTSFTVYVQVWKDGVTNFAGQGAGITCSLNWSPVGYFGGDWATSTSTPMTYNPASSGSNDEYMATITPPVGLYEFTTVCTDTTDSTAAGQGAGNGRLVVDAASGACNSAIQGDNVVYYNGLLHDSFSAAYRSPIGPVTTAQGSVTLKFRTCLDDLNSQPSIRVYDDFTDAEAVITPLTFDAHAVDATLGGVTFWSIDLAIPTDATILYYTFSATDGATTVYYRDDDPKFYGGGYGAVETNQATAYNNSYQLTVYDPAYAVPEWMQRGVIYQIFPDRFRDGNAANNPAAGRFSYDQPGGTIARSNQSDWNTTVCDPRQAATDCTGKYGDNFYGGDLAGITDKINQGYFNNLGVSVLYLNPIFRAPSNHKYDTADYMTIDPDFGTLADFQALTAAAHAHGIQVMLDGVFNHTSSDSTYFDRYNRYDSAGNLTSSGLGTDDNSGACEAGTSPYYSWFYFPATGNPGKDGATTVYCANGVSDAGQTYEAWYGYSSLPKLQANSDDVRALIWNNSLNSVGPYWVSQGADAWRFDVGGDVDPGLTRDSDNNYWEGFRAAVRNAGVTGKTDVVMLGEEWGDASPWLLGHEWDSVMNYRFRSAVLSWLFTGCSGSNCTGGTLFQDNDSNNNSSSGPISYLSPSQFNARLRSIQEDYPPQAFNAMMNLAGSHDTNRVRYLLKKINNDNDTAALQRLKEWWLFAFTYAGAPTLYYGDEIALSHDGVWDGSMWQDDPYNRAPYPWPDESGSAYSPVIDTLQFERQMASIRWSYRALQDGAVQHGLIVDDANQLYGFARTNGSQTALIALNRSGSAHNATFTGLNAAPYNLANGTVLYDAIEGNTYTVSGGAVTVPVNATWGVVLLEQSKIDEPQAVTNLSVAVSGADNVLSWRPVFTDTANDREVVSYQIYRGSTAAFTPATGTLIATVAPANFGLTNGVETYTHTEGANQGYYYRVVPVNSAGRVATTLPIEASSDNHAVATVAASTVITFAGQTNSVNFSTTGGATYVALQTYPDTPHPDADQNNGGAYMLARYYTLSTDGADFDTRLCLGYDQSELGSLTEDLLRLCRWSGSAWTCYPRSTQSDIVANVVCADNVTAFSDWTLGTVGPTAVTLNDLQTPDRATSPIGWVLLVALMLSTLVIIRKRVIIKR